MRREGALLLKASISDSENSVWPPPVICSVIEAKWPNCSPFFLSDFWKLNSPRLAQSLNKSSRKSQKAGEQTEEQCFVTYIKDTEQVNTFNFDTLLWLMES